MEFSTYQIFIAFLLSLLAGISTCIGAVAVFFLKKDSPKVLSIGLSFSAGMMIYISFMEILPVAFDGFSSLNLGIWDKILGLVCFFIGILLSAFVDKLIPNDLHKQEQNAYKELKFELVGEQKAPYHTKKLQRMGVLLAIIIALHNFPEGFATFISTLSDFSFGLVIALAVMIHNIPEGMMVSLPIYHSTGSKKKAFVYATLSGLSEPLGALVCALALLPFMSETVLAVIFALVAGIMVYISFDELLPAAKFYGKAHHCLYGLLVGMGVMAFSLLLLNG